MCIEIFKEIQIANEGRSSLHVAYKSKRHFQIKEIAMAGVEQCPKPPMLHGLEVFKLSCKYGWQE